jgi:hypothetical protein
MEVEAKAKVRFMGEIVTPRRITAPGKANLRRR